MRDDRRDGGQHLRLRYEPLDADVRRDGTKSLRIDVTADRDDRADVGVAERFEERLEGRRAC